jgi:hypothetical protein
MRTLFVGLDVHKETVSIVGWQEDELGAGVPDCTTDCAGFVAAEIVHHHDVAWQ